MRIVQAAPQAGQYKLFKKWKLSKSMSSQCRHSPLHEEVVELSLIHI